MNRRRCEAWRNLGCALELATVTVIAAVIHIVTIACAIARHCYKNCKTSR